MKNLFRASLLAIGLMSAPAWAQFANYLKIDTIDGESTAVGHERWIDVTSWAWGVSQVQSTSNTDGGNGRASFADFAWSQYLDASVVPLFLGVANGTTFKDATLDVVKDSGTHKPESFFQMIFSNVSLHSLTTSGGDSRPVANGALGYEAVKMRYRPQDAKGGPGKWIEGSFDIKKDKLQFSGDPMVIEGLFASGGQVSLAAAVPAVPEPANWALMAAGVLLLTGTMAVRRRERIRLPGTATR